MKSMNNASYYKINKSKFMNLEAVFKNPAAIEVETLNTGKIISKISGLLNLKNKNASKLKEGTAIVPVLAHIVKHEKYGDYLIDTGFDSSFSNEVGGNFNGKGYPSPIFYKWEMDSPYYFRFDT